jgi:hypothetical protein
MADGDATAGLDLSAITPTPTEEEAAAIVAALTLAWPRPAVADEPTGPTPTTWRFSGRWWNKPTWRRR